jgi:excisionase family DNA binding protein
MSAREVLIPSSKLVGSKDAADLLKVSRNTVLNWAKAGIIQIYKLGKIYRFELKKVLEAASAPAKSI